MAQYCVALHSKKHCHRFTTIDNIDPTAYLTFYYVYILSPTIFTIDI